MSVRSYYLQDCRFKRYTYTEVKIRFRDFWSAGSRHALIMGNFLFHKTGEMSSITIWPQNTKIRSRVFLPGIKAGAVVDSVQI